MRQRLSGRKVGNRLCYPRETVARVAREMGRPMPETSQPRRYRSQSSPGHGGVALVLAGLIATVAMLLWSAWPSTAPEPVRTPRLQQVTPTFEIVQREPTARCVDGTLSFSQTRQGTCSWHGGVAVWFP